MINLTNLEVYIAYFKSLAQNNTTLAHIDQTNVTFGVLDMITNKVSATITNKALVLEYPEYSHVGGNENHEEDINGAFWIIKKPQSKSFDHIQLALKEAKLLANEILSRMLYDFLREEIEDFDLSNVSMQKLGPWSTSELYGWRVEFKITSPAPLPFDATKWNDID